MKIEKLKSEILRLFTRTNIDHLTHQQSELVQKVMRALINQPTQNVNINPQEFQRAYEILNHAPNKDNSLISETSLKNTPEVFSKVDVNLVLQALRVMNDNQTKHPLQQKMEKILQSLAQGNSQTWLNLSKSMKSEDIIIYGFLKEAFQRAQSPTSSSVVEGPVKRSQKRFWNGGISV